MKRIGVLSLAIFLLFVLGSCGGGQPVGEKLEVSLVPPKDVKIEAKGTAVIDAKTGTDITINITGLKPDGVYTVFFVNVKSQMFDGIGKAPYVLQVDANGSVNFKGGFEKDIYKRYKSLAVFLNPGKKPIANPLGVKAALGVLLASEKPKMILEGKLR